MAQEFRFDKKYLVFLFVIGVIASYFMARFMLQRPKDPTKAAPGVPILSYAIDPSSVVPGDGFDLIIQVNPNGSSFNAFELYSRFDPTKVEFQNTTVPSQNITSNHVLINQSVNPDNSQITIIGTKLNDPFTGDTEEEIARITMKVLDHAQGELVFGWNLDTKLGNNIPKDARDGVFSLGVTETPIPTEDPPGESSLSFKLKLPDITAQLISLADAQVEISSGGTSIDTVNTILIKNGEYYETASPIDTSNMGSGMYDVFVKTRISIGRLFNAVNLVPGKNLDCINVADPDCGELFTERDIKIFHSGDSDGFNEQSGSYNKIDSADLQVVSLFFNQPGTGAAAVADFNLDGQVEISDLEIIGKNYGQVGD